MVLFKYASAAVTLLCKKEAKVQPQQFPFPIMLKSVPEPYVPFIRQSGLPRALFES